MGVKLGRLSLGFLNSVALRAFMHWVWADRCVETAPKTSGQTIHFTCRPLLGGCAHFLEMTSLLESASDDEADALSDGTLGAVCHTSDQVAGRPALSTPFED